MLTIDGKDYSTATVLLTANILGILSVALFLFVNSLFIIGTFIAVASMVLVIPFLILDDIFTMVKKLWNKK